MKKGFTLIELLAVIVILAIIALIATPIILGTINDAKKSATELSLKNYIRAVELAISNESLNNPTVDLNGTYEIIVPGNKIQLIVEANENNKPLPINIEYSGEGLTEGTLKIKEGKVIKVTAGKINEDYIMKYGDKIITYKKLETLVSGTDFNKKIKQLVDPSNESITHSTEDTTITSIEFYSNGEVPKETKEKLETLNDNNKVDVSASGDNSIIAYYDNGKVYVISDNLISFNQACNSMFNNFKALTEIKFGIIDTSNTKSMVQMFLDCSALKNLDLSSFDTSNVEGTGFQQMFRRCYAIETLDLSSFDTSKVTDLSFMFYDCTALKSVDLSSFDTSIVKDMNNMFNNCNILETLDLSSFDTSKVENMSNMFGSCKALKTLDLSNFNTISVKDNGMQSMFGYCTGLESIKFGENFKTDNIKSMRSMFINCESIKFLDLSSFNTSSVTNMRYMFSNCYKLESIKFGNNFNTSNVTDMEQMFYNCNNLATLDLRNFNTSGVTNMKAMFMYTSKLKPIFIGDNWIIGESTITTEMFVWSATQDTSQLCEPNSTKEWCVVLN